MEWIVKICKKKFYFLFFPSISELSAPYIKGVYFYDANKFWGPSIKNAKFKLFLLISHAKITVAQCCIGIAKPLSIPSSSLDGI